MARKQRRFTLIGAGVGILGLAVGLVLFALRGSIVFFNSPTDLVEKHLAPGTRIRLGGMVVPGSIVHPDGLTIRFQVTDGNNTVPVTCSDKCAVEIPDLFREGQGVVTEGTLDPSGSGFTAARVLAKHDERYMPREVADALKNSKKTDAGTRKTP
jgi:cytochrome c-type biogenesis protein CcmE